MKIPIRTRLTAIYCTVFCVSTLLLELGAYAALAFSINAVVDSELQARLSGVEGFLEEHVGRRTLPKLQSEIATHAALKPELLQISRVGEGELFRGRSMAWYYSSRKAKPPDAFATVNSHAMPLRVLSARRTAKGQSYDFYLGADLTVPSEMLRSFRCLVLFSSPIVFACAFLAGSWISKRALLPVSRLTNAARSINAANLSERLTVANTHDELEDLAQTLNGMLSRIEDAFRHVTQFTANASHELRTPLALIRTTAEVALLRPHGDADHYREALHRVLREAEKNSVLLDDLLCLARADASGHSLTLQPLDFGSHIRQLYERVLPLAVEKRLRLEHETTEEGLWVLAHPEHLKRLWLILLDNTFKYTPPGGLITISWRFLPPESLVCEIKDTGIGISEADLPRIFERFYQADKARSREETGAGLGLSMARWIVNAHRATIEVESVPGQGSLFRVIFPTGAHRRPETARPALQSAGAHQLTL
jgi:heavy metal sensor kinase